MTHALFMASQFIHFARQQFRQRRAVRQIAQFETQTRGRKLQFVHQRRENAQRGKVRNPNL